MLKSFFFPPFVYWFGPFFIFLFYLFIPSTGPWICRGGSTRRPSTARDGLRAESGAEPTAAWFPVGVPARIDRTPTRVARDPSDFHHSVTDLNENPM